jgi:GTPase SAR1 family protein
LKLCIAHFPMSEKNSTQLKLLLIGDSAVGKTSLLLRYMDDKFSQSFVSTIGIDFKVKQTSIDGQNVRMQIWDTAGQERFRTITTSYFRGAHGILLAFDLTERRTFLSVENWVRQITDHLKAQGSNDGDEKQEDGGDDVALILVGTKSDMVEKLQVTEVEGQALAAKHQMRFFATSAKFNSNVKEAFDALARSALIKSQKLTKTKSSSNINIAKTSEDKPKDGKGCQC